MTRFVTPRPSYVSCYLSSAETTTMLKKKLLGLGLPMFVMLLFVQSNSAHAKRRIAIEFQKSPISPSEWVGMGTSSDGTEVAVGAVLTKAETTGPVTHVTEFTYCFAPKSAPTQLVEIALTGIITEKGRIVLNGVVATSALSTVPSGTQVQLRAQADASFNVTGSLYMTVP